MNNLTKIPGYNNRYAITRDGRVWSNVTNRWLKQNKDKNGYFQLGLWLNTQPRCFRVHRLVALTFMEPEKGRPCINHIDGDKTNNSVENLEWCTLAENMSLAWKTGLKKPLLGSKHALAKLTEKEVLQIREKYKTGRFTHKQLARKYGVERTVVTNIVNLKRWRHI